MKNVFELSIKVFLTQDIKSEECSSSISDLIDKSLSKSKKYLEFHNDNKYKNYTFDMLYPLSDNKVYKKENIYTFRFRTIDLELLNYINENLINEHTNCIKVLTISKKTIPIKHIEKIYNITPVILKFENGYWKRHSSIQEVEKRLRENIIKKYNSYYNTKIEEDFELFTLVTIKNNKPIKVNYKEIGLLGDKFEIVVSENELAQELVNFSLGVGLGEMNARGLGFINYRWI
ncbi:MAG: CRISPR-associated endoribonuclease Cas6 [Peptostreptococcaceae bacterium]